MLSLSKLSSESRNLLGSFRIFLDASLRGTHAVRACVSKGALGEEPGGSWVPMISTWSPIDA